VQVATKVRWRERDDRNMAVKSIVSEEIRGGNVFCRETALSCSGSKLSSITQRRIINPRSRRHKLNHLYLYQATPTKIEKHARPHARVPKISVRGPSSTYSFPRFHFPFISITPHQTKIQKSSPKARFSHNRFPLFGVNQSLHVDMCLANWQIKRRGQSSMAHVRKDNYLHLWSFIWCRVATPEFRAPDLVKPWG